MLTGRDRFLNAGRRLLVIGAHWALWAVAYFGAFLLRFGGTIPESQRTAAFYGFFVLLAIRSVCFWFPRLFHGLLQYAGIPEVWSIVRATTVSTILFVGTGVAVRSLLQPRSIYVGEWLLAILAASSLRLAARVLRERKHGPHVRENVRRALLVGAGDAGEMFLRDLERSRSSELLVVGVLDDSPTKQGSQFRGLRVRGPINAMTLRRASEDFDARLAVLALPSASGARNREIVSACRDLGIETKTLPSLQQILNDEVKVSMLRDVAIEDLLRREPVRLDEPSMAAFLRGKRVLITGGAGSIGSELARQACRYAPASLTLLDHNENGLFALERELLAAFPKLPIHVLIADVKDARRVNDVLRRIRPHAIFHAAAHKHVPLMEDNPCEAVKNNVFGTRVVAELANAYGVDTFVLISTDKAVNPTSVMGATKRVAEMYIQSLSTRARTRFVAVRFGNVLGSAGSVVPLFREQIAAGGPVTVTHADMRRYFMTIPEASQLVLQAGALAQGGELFVLDMGDPVKIVDLARDMIRMSGLEPDTDIPIVFTGTRPGEKLFEELMHDGEGYQRTVHPKISVGRISPIEHDQMLEGMRRLVAAIDAAPDELRRVLATIVPEARFQDSGTEETARAEETLHDLEAVETLGFPAAVSRSG